MLANQRCFAVGCFGGNVPGIGIGGELASRMTVFRAVLDCRSKMDNPVGRRCSSVGCLYRHSMYGRIELGGEPAFEMTIVPLVQLQSQDSCFLCRGLVYVIDGRGKSARDLTAGDLIQESSLDSPLLISPLNI